MSDKLNRFCCATVVLDVCMLTMYSNAVDKDVDWVDKNGKVIIRMQLDVFPMLVHR